MEHVTSADGTRIAYYGSGREDGPTVVAVHGYPDDHTVWDGVVAQLGSSFRTVTYDVRGAGASDRPDGTAAYAMPHLVDDLVAVLDSVGGAPVHLLGHDWGSVQLWDAALDPRVRERVAGFTSISGPSLGYLSAWLGRGVRSASRPALRQLAHSWYTLAFRVPRLPELAIDAGLLDRTLKREGDHGQQAAGLRLYRANLRGLAARRPQRLDLPVQVIAPIRDPYVTAAAALGSPVPYVAQLRTHEIPGGHWVIRSRPDVVVRLVRDFVTDLTGVQGQTAPTPTSSPDNSSSR